MTITHYFARTLAAFFAVYVLVICTAYALGKEDAFNAGIKAERCAVITEFNKGYCK